MVEVPSVDAAAPLGAGSAAHGQDTLLTLAALGLIVEHLDQPVFAKDREHRLVLVNGAFCDLLGGSRGALLQHREEDVFQELVEQPLEYGVFEHGSPTGGARVFRTSAGASVVRHTTFVPLIDAQGSVTHVVGVVGHAGEGMPSPDRFQEELERYAVERTTALRAMQQDLLRRERMSVLSQLAAGLAHQLRNHLTAIISAMSIVRKHVANTDKSAHQALEHASNAAFESSATIGELLEYTKPRAPKPMWVSLQDIVSDALELTPPPSGVRVQSSVPDIEVFVDSQQVRDAVRKVIRNAYEAMAGKGELRLSVAAQDVSPGEMVELRISDTGVGVSEQHRELLFEPMITSKPLGLGLGLASALALVTQQGGSLECLRDVDSGACFALRLPTAAHQPLDEGRRIV